MKLFTGRIISQAFAQCLQWMGSALLLNLMVFSAFDISGLYVRPPCLRQSAVETLDVANVLSCGQRGQGVPDSIATSPQRPNQGHAAQIPGNWATWPPGLGNWVSRFASLGKSLSRRIFIQGESKCFMVKDWRVWGWFSIWGFQLLNRGTICQFWFQFYKHDLFRRLNLCEHECPNETWHFPLLNAPSLGKGSKEFINFSWHLEKYIISVNVWKQDCSPHGGKVLRVI